MDCWRLEDASELQKQDNLRRKGVDAELWALQLQQSLSSIRASSGKSGSASRSSAHAAEPAATRSPRAGPEAGGSTRPRSPRGDLQATSDGEQGGDLERTPRSKHLPRRGASAEAFGDLEPGGTRSQQPGLPPHSGVSPSLSDADRRLSSSSRFHRLWQAMQAAGLGNSEPVCRQRQPLQMVKSLSQRSPLTAGSSSSEASPTAGVHLSSKAISQRSLAFTSEAPRASESPPSAKVSTAAKVPSLQKSPRGVASTSSSVSTESFHVQLLVLNLVFNAISSAPQAWQEQFKAAIETAVAAHVGDADRSRARYNVKTAPGPRLETAECTVSVDITLSNIVKSTSAARVMAMKLQPPSQRLFDAIGRRLQQLEGMASVCRGTTGQIQVCAFAGEPSASGGEEPPREETDLCRTQ